MELLNKVKTDLQKRKGYDFSSDFWTDELFSILYDAVYSTEKSIKEKISKNKLLDYEANKYAEKVNGDYGKKLYPMCDETINEITIKEFKAGYEYAQNSI